MVTLLGFGFILTNVIFLEIFMPDLVGPVRKFCENGHGGELIWLYRGLHGYTIVSLLGYGCTRPWITWMESKREEQAHPAD